MHYAGLKKNDVVDGKGICVSYWAQGCPFHCVGCHNPETWDFNGGLQKQIDELGEEILTAISANGIVRNFSILGGEPLHTKNLYNTSIILGKVRNQYPNIKVYLWTGYTIEVLNQKRKEEPLLDYILKNVDIIIDGQYIQEQRDITLELRGSRNQRILERKKDF